MTDESVGAGRPRGLAREEVLAAFDHVDAPVATAKMLSNHVDVSRKTVLRRLRELEGDGKVKKLETGSRSMVWWPVD